MEKVGVWRGISGGDFEVVNDYITIIRRIIRLVSLKSAQTHFLGRTYRIVGLSAKVPTPGANAFFPPRFLREDPIFPPISRQPTIGISSIHVNRLTGCRSIYWRCLLIFKTWPWYRSHYPEETHFLCPRDLKIPYFPQYLKNQP